MTLKEYFEGQTGIGVLATADSDGNVDVAVYGRPHFIEEDVIAFIMADHLSHRNLQSNNHAAYLFLEAGEGYKGKRLHLTKIKEEKDSERIRELRRHKTSPARESQGEETSTLVYFRIDRVRPAVGG